MSEGCWGCGVRLVELTPIFWWQSRMPKIRKTGTVRARRTGEGKSGLVYGQYLNSAGQPAMSPSLATYLVTVHNPAALSRAQLEFEARSLRLGGNHWCHGAINPRYIARQMHKASYILKLEALNSRTGATMQLGFASMINQGQGVLYIDLICARVTDLVRASAGLGKNSAGGLLMKQIATFAQQPQFGFTQLKLSALPYVVGFYDRLGFRLDTPDTPLVREITENLRTFRFRSSDEFDVAYEMSRWVKAIQSPDERGQPLSNEQKERLAFMVNDYKDTLKEERRLGNLSGAIDRYYNEALADPEHMRSLQTDIRAIRKLKLAPGGIINGIRMVYDLSPARGGGVRHRRQKTRRQQRRRHHRTRKSVSVKSK